MVPPQVQVEDGRQPPPEHRENFSGPAAFAMILLALIFAVLMISLLTTQHVVNTGT